MSTITITFGDQAENHAGMQMIGSPAKSGFTFEELKELSEEYWVHGSEFIDLGDSACLLIIRKGVNNLFKRDGADDDLLKEHLSLSFDKKAFMYGRVVNKHARWNLCFADFSQEPDYENGKGRIYNFADLPMLKVLRKAIGVHFGDKAKNLVAESNYYYDVKKCFINMHIDKERKIVIAVRLGETFPLHYQWYQNSKPIGERRTFQINHGDIYIMSEKATGNDGQKKLIKTLRHAAGFEENLKKK